jgi:glycosyltransferase A (GT-A) superfamily protein (DUF2064 family)
MKTLILIFAQQPLEGQVLPGLVPPLSPVYAAMLYHAMLRDQLRACKGLDGVSLRICFAKGLLPGSFEGDLQWEIQRGADPAETRVNAFRSAFRWGATQVMALNLEPALYPATLLPQALASLDSASVVLGEGMLGLTRVLPGVIAAEPHLMQGTAQAYDLKVRKIEGGLSFEGLASLRAALRQNPELAPLSAMLLASIP